MQPTEFLISVWSQQCQPGEYVCLSSKGKDGWRDRLFPFDDQLNSKIDRWLEAHSDADLYFCPLPFSGSRRSKSLVTRSRFAWADIDDGDVGRIRPSILWQSSPGRYQGLWRLPAAVDPASAADMSRRIAYQIGGDRGGWDLTQALRIPGTPNNKYPDRPIVKLEYFTDRVAKIPQTALDRWRSKLPRALVRTIEGPAEVGKRSEVLWRLENELSEAGVPIDDIVAILRDSEWNKFRGRADEEERFRSEMEKIIGERPSARRERVVFEVVEFAALMSTPPTPQQWLIEDYWARGSHGIVAGEPKSFKSTLVTDMLYSVASGTPFLGRFAVKTQGPVIVVQNENTDNIMRDRLDKLMVARSGGRRVEFVGNKLRFHPLPDVPMHFINQQGFTLDDAGHKDALEEMIDRLRPVAITLDPLYLMFTGDVNSAKDLYPVLQWCLHIKQQYGCAVILVHHYNKGGEGRRGGQRMLGSTTLHGWIESAWYLQVSTAEPGVVTIDREFRGAGMYDLQDIRLQIGPMGSSEYAVDVVEHQAGGPNFEQDILSVLGSTQGTLNVKEIMTKTALSDSQVRKTLVELVADGRVKRHGERYGLASDDAA